VVYILDQVRALEQEMRRRLEEQGLPDIKPNIMVVTRLIPQVGGGGGRGGVSGAGVTWVHSQLKLPLKGGGVWA
jgi:hypothetical protein